MAKCKKCNTVMEANTKFCTNCGEQIIDKTTSTDTNNKDLSWFFLIISFVMGIPGGILQVKNGYEATVDLTISQYLTGLSRLDNISSELYAEIIGGSMAPMIISSIIVGFIWGIKSIMSKKYAKPIQSIFIGSLIFSILGLFAH